MSKDMAADNTSSADSATNYAILVALLEYLLSAQCISSDLGSSMRTLDEWLQTVKTVAKSGHIDLHKFIQEHGVAMQIPIPRIYGMSFNDVRG